MNDFRDDKELDDLMSCVDLEAMRASRCAAVENESDQLDQILGSVDLDALIAEARPQVVLLLLQVRRDRLLRPALI